MTRSPVFSAEELAQLKAAMDWVIPPDKSSPNHISSGAGTDVTLNHLIDLLEDLGDATIAEYRLNLPYLAEADLSDSSNRFGQLFINHVRDTYYGYPDTGAWAELGFAPGAKTS
jgi:hypothetical protein